MKPARSKDHFAMLPIASGRQVPIDHHYLPIFYLKRWVGEDGRLCRFNQPRDEIKARRVSPKKTAYEERLYETPGIPPEHAQQIEQRFMQPLDTFAAEALVLLENGDERIHREPEPRSAWSCFIMSLLLRTPENLDALKSGWEEEFRRHLPELEAKYALRKQPGDPLTFEQSLAAVLAKDPFYFDRCAMELAPKLIDHSGIGQLLNDMIWVVRHLPDSAGELLTSDRPIVRSWTLTETNAYLFLPIGPNTLFIAVSDAETKWMVEHRDPVEQVEAVNHFVVGQAVKFVYARDDSRLDYVHAYMGTKRKRTLIEQLVEHRRDMAAASD